VIPLLDLRKQIAPLRKEIDAAIKKVIDSGHFVMGKEVEDFEAQCARYCRVKYALGVSNGTDAIRLGLVSLGIKPGDGVICPTFTYYATAGAVASIGARPVFADIDQLTYNILPESVVKALKANKNVKAIIPVHLYGQCANMDRVLKIASRFGLKVIEDAAQAFGAEYLGKKAGTMGDCGAVSFFPGKNLGAFGDAGMLLTNSRATYEKVKVLRNQGNKERYFHTACGFNHRLDSIQAAMLSIKLKHLDSWNKSRMNNAAYFDKNLKYSGVGTPFVPEYTTHIYHQYVLRVKDSNKGLVERLRSKGVDSRVYYPLPLHLQKCFKYLGYKKGDFPVAEKASREVLAIPVYPELTQKDADFIIRTIKEFLDE